MTAIEHREDVAETAAKAEDTSATPADRDQSNALGGDIATRSGATVVPPDEEAETQ